MSKYWVGNRLLDIPRRGAPWRALTQKTCWILILYPQDFFIYSIIRFFLVPFTVNLVAQNIYLNAQNPAIKLLLSKSCFFPKSSPADILKQRSITMLETTDVISVVMEHEQIFMICDICGPSLPSEESNTIKKYWFSSPSGKKLIKWRPYELELRRENMVFEGLEIF